MGVIAILRGAENKKGPTVSRVMSFKVVIYLGLLLPTASSVQPCAGGPRTRILELASDGVYMATAVTSDTVVSYTAFPPLPEKSGGIFLLHYPWSYLHRPLAGILAL